MELNHFSHEHPLILKDAPKADVERLCYGCERPISEVEPAYGCGECSKDYFLHKVCAELPREIMHPMHDSHSLILLHKSPYEGGGFFCNECPHYFDGFTYQCSLCEFDLDISCALKDNDVILCASKNRNIRHKGHNEHSLMLQPRPAFFLCNACGVEDKDQSYLCPSCPFYVHKSCASLPVTAKREDHDCDLILAYELPSDYRNFRFDCNICRKRIFYQYWVYYCGPCRYFVHLKCMTTKTQQQIEANSDDDDLLDDANFEKKLLKVLLFDDLLHLPAIDISKELIGRFLLRKNSLAQIQPNIKHLGHEQHPLILYHGLPNDYDMEEDEEILCNGCVEPISAAAGAPYYSCVECSYFLHLTCAKLPNRLQHPTHLHPLTLGCHEKIYDTFCCDTCGRSSNGFFFKCETCNFYLDVKCAAMPTIIEHESHNHPLFQSQASNKSFFQSQGSFKLCNACNSLVLPEHFGCESCNFYLHTECAMLPRDIRHRWDPHPFALRFPPYKDHPDIFICDMCEYEMHPLHWLYHCSGCDNSFHTYCVPRLTLHNRNIKYGGTLEVSAHPHPVKFVHKPTLRSSCNHCGDEVWRNVFECEDCNFCLCLPCIRKMS